MYLYINKNIKKVIALADVDFTPFQGGVKPVTQFQLRSRKNHFKRSTLNSRKDWLCLSTEGAVHIDNQCF